MPADVTTRDESLASLEAGLDALGAVEAGRRPLWRRVTSKTVPPLVAVLVVLAVWQGAVWLHVKPPFVLPSPHDVGASLVDQARSGALFDGVWRSLSRGLLGFAASVVIGTPLGLAVARIGPLRTAIKPILSGLQSLPSVAWVPAAVIWFSLSNTAIYFVVLMGAVPSIANGMVSGLDQVPPLHEKVGTVLGARGLRAARYVLLPSALPGYLGGLRQGWAFAWRSLMAAELITQSPQLGTGLGQQLDQARTLSDISLVFGLILVILVVGVAIELLVFAPLERGVLRRRGLLVG